MCQRPEEIQQRILVVHCAIKQHSSQVSEKKNNVSYEQSEACRCRDTGRDVKKSVWDELGVVRLH
jgi:hypothetical protein